MLTGKKILLCVTGSIAAYKSVILVRLLIKAQAEVKVIMTTAAMDFVSPLTFSTLSKNKVLSNLFDQEMWTNHVMLGRWAEVMLVAPASCNTISKMANGICDNLLQATYLSAICPVVIAPAMDEDMWRHAATKRNIDLLKEYGHTILPVNNGELASGLTGEGRMGEPEEILKFLEKFLSEKLSLSGKKILITAGPTYEPIDPVRFIGNHSSGKMGICIASEFAARGAEVTLILGPSSETVSVNVTTIKVTSANEMYNAFFSYFDESDIIVMAAAVADFTPEDIALQKIKKNGNELTLKLKKTPDILSKAGEMKTNKQVLVGFALETENEKTNALKKLHNKNADLIVLNSLNDNGAGFGHDTNKIIIFNKKGEEQLFEKKPKREVATDIVNAIINFKNE